MTDPRLLIVMDSKDIELGRSGPGLMDYVIGFGMIALMLFGVFAFGAVEEWAVFALEAGAVCIFLLWIVKGLRAGQIDFGNRLYVPAVAFAALIAAQIIFGLSVYPYATKYAALKYVIYAVALVVGSECFRTSQMRRLLAIVLSVFVALYASFALIQGFTSNGKIFWTIPLRFGGWMYGSYVNHSHYAGLVEMLVAFPLVLAAGRVLGAQARSLAAFGAVLAGISIFVSGSRGGMVAFTAAVMFLGLLHFRRERGRLTVAVYVLLCLGFLVALAYFSRGEVFVRLKDLNPIPRWRITMDSLKMLRERPLMGWGLGTFATAYPKFRTFYTNNFVNEAHNDYAQVLVETGVVGFAITIWFLVNLFRASSLHNWRYRWENSVGLAALLGCIALLVHSSVDFNLQIPANAAFFYFLCGISASTQNRQQLR